MIKPKLWLIKAEWDFLREWRKKRDIEIAVAYQKIWKKLINED